MPDFLYPTCKITASQFNYRYWKQGESLENIAIDLGISSASLRYHALKNGLRTRSPQEAHQLAVETGARRTYSANYDLFEFWSPEMAWVLGLIASDGNVDNKVRRVSFVSKDKSLVEKARHILAYTKPVKPKAGCFEMRIYSRRLAESLVALNVTPNKGFTLQMPPIPTEFMRHFVRGFFDGDGCVSIKSRAREWRWPRLTVAFYCPSPRFLDSLGEEFVAQNIRFFRETTNPKDGIRKPMHLIYIGGYEAIQLFHYMYDNVDKSCYLERKHTIFMDYITEHGYRYANGPLVDSSHRGQPCTVEGCDRPHRALGLCLKHYNQEYHKRYKQRPKPQCSMTECNKEAVALKGGLCHMHYMRERRARKHHVT